MSRTITKTRADGQVITFEVGGVRQWTPENVERICEFIRQGNFINTSVQAAGFSAPSFYTHLKRAKQHVQACLPPEDAGEDYVHVCKLKDNPTYVLRLTDETCRWYIETFLMVEQARAAAEAANVSYITADKSWQARAWWLERTKPEKYGRIDRSEVTGKDGGPVAVKLPDEQLARIAQAVKDQLNDKTHVPLLTGTSDADSDELIIDSEEVHD